MNVREKLVEQAISHFWYGVSHDIFSEPVTTYAKLAIEALKKENGVTVQEWISVKDRLPEPWKQVLIYSRNDFCESAVYIGVPGKWRVTWNHEMLEADSVTHWMPLPHLPKGE